MPRREVRPHRAPPRADHPPPGRPARSALARRRAARLPARRDLQPRRDVVRRRLMDPADPHGGVHRRRRDAAAGGRARGLPGGALLPGELERDVRQGARDAPDGGHAVLPALALWRREGLRALHHRQLPRVLRHAPVVGHPLQPRVAAPRAGVRHAQDHVARRGDQAREARRAAAGQPRRPARLGLREGLRRSDVGGCSSSTRRRTSSSPRARRTRSAGAWRWPSTASASTGSSTSTFDPAFLRPAEVDLLVGDPGEGQGGARLGAAAHRSRS